MLTILLSSLSASASLIPSFPAMNLEAFSGKHDAMFTFLPDGIEEHENAGLTVSPNPVADVLHIRLDDHNWESIDLMDVEGKLIKSMNINGLNEVALDMSALAKGVYILRASSMDRQLNQRVLKN